MAASSISTYLDVTRAATGAATKGGPQTDWDAVALGAKVLAAIHAGGELSMTELAQQTQLEMSQLLSIIASLGDQGLAEVEEREGVIRVRLTEATKAALTA